MAAGRKIQSEPSKAADLRWGVLTPWTLLLQNDPKHAASLERLLTVYRAPVYAFYRAQRLSESDAEDLTQHLLMDFFLVRASHAQAQPAHGRFRNYLLTSAKHVLLDWKKHGRSVKRGGKVAHVPLDSPNVPDAAETHGVTPDEHFDRHWAVATWHAAYEVFRTRTSEQLVQAFELYYSGTQKISQETAAQELGISLAAFNSRLHTARRRFYTCIKDIVQTTVEDPAELDRELADLHALLARGGFMG